ncbi:MAG: hypothetical protein Q8O66_01040 [bacterium]|nr:hypothetical protein [bacterium]
MARKREHEWFLEPCGDVAHSNEIISKIMGVEENAMQDMLCTDGKRRNLWRCPSGLVFMIWKSRGNFGKSFKIKIFCREGKGKIRDVTFLFKDEGGGTKRKRKKVYRGRF